MPEKLRKFAATSLLLMSALVLSLLLVEGGMRVVFRGQSDVRLYEYHPKYLYRLRPNASGWHTYRPTRDTREKVWASTSPQGFRDREFGAKAKGEYRILMLGDSYTFGKTVEASDTISNQLTDLMRESHPTKDIFAINAGTHGTGPWQQLGLLLDRGLALEPDIVVHQLYLGNDLHDTLVEVDGVLDAYLPGWQTRLDAWRRMHLRRFRIDRWLELRFVSYRTVRHAVGEEKWFEMLSTLPLVASYKMPARAPSIGRPVTIESDLREWYPKLEHAMDRMLATIEETRETCAARGIDYAVYCIPPKESAYRKNWERLMERSPDALAYERNKGIRFVREVLNEKGIAWIPVSDVLMDSDRSDALYFEYDGHLTPKGNRMVAERVTAYLDSEYLQ